MNEKIFISEGSMKHRKSNLNHRVPNVASTGTTPTAATTRSTTATTAPTTQTTGTDVAVSELKTGKGPILLEMWVKYFKYSDLDVMKSNTPKSFYKNNEFYNQLKYFPGASLQQKETDGSYTFIRDKGYFYGVLFTNTLNFITSRQVPYFIKL